MPLYAAAWSRRWGGVDFITASLFLIRYRWQAVVEVKSHNNNHIQDTDLAFDLILFTHEN